MDTKTNRAALVAGDKVVIQRAYGNGLVLAEVTRTTKTQVTCGTQRFSIMTGSEIGEGYRSADRLFLPGEKVYANGPTYLEKYHANLAAIEAMKQKAPYINFLLSLDATPFRNLDADVLKQAAELLGYQP